MRVFTRLNRLIITFSLYPKCRRISKRLTNTNSPVNNKMKFSTFYLFALEEKELADGKTDVEITCRYLDNSKTVKGFSDLFTLPHEKSVSNRKKR